MDTDDPYIIGFEFKGKGNKDADGAPVETTDYGFYFLEDTLVTISARDDIPTSGVKSISYYTLDFTNNMETGVKSAIKTANVNANDQISFTIPANFKGQIMQ